MSGFVTAATEIKLNRREVRQLGRTHDLLVQWVRNHEEMCEDRMQLLALQRSVRSAGKILDRIEAEARR